jgi:hypothetical protein
MKCFANIWNLFRGQIQKWEKARKQKLKSNENPTTSVTKVYVFISRLLIPKYAWNLYWKIHCFSKSFERYRNFYNSFLSSLTMYIELTGHTLIFRESYNFESDILLSVSCTNSHIHRKPSLYNNFSCKCHLHLPAYISGIMVDFI